MKRYFGEWVICETGNEEECKNYLSLWKKFLLVKIARDSENVKFLTENWIERDALYTSVFGGSKSIALKICVDVNFKHELLPDGTTCEPYEMKCSSNE